jgi:hypothetical protein
MMHYLWLVLVAVTLGFLLYRAGRVWVDAGQWHPSLVARLSWSLLGALAPARYYWGARVQAMSPAQQAAFLARETRILGLSRADAMHCPLTGTEIPHAWGLSAEGRPRVGHLVRCPECDFRLDACRHCANFLPGSPRDWGEEWTSRDITYGRCKVYKAMQPVEQAYAPGIARRLKAQGYEQIRAPLFIADSYFPPDYCTTYEPDRKRLRAAGIAWPNARRVALLHLLSAEVSP